jgi:hypothetical protein
MNITPRHRKCFKEALYYIGQYTNWLCNAIDATTASEATKQECKDILFYYFQSEPGCAVLWLSMRDGLDYEELLTCRLIALYTLIYAPL